MKHVTYNIKKIIVVIAFLSYVTGYMLHVTRIFAQEISLAIAPPLIETVIKPGKSIMIAYQLANLGDPIIIKTKVLPFIALGNSGNIKIKRDFEGPIRFSLDNSLIKLEDPFFLKSNDSQQLLLRIRVPEGAPEGDYYYTLLAETEPPPGTEGVTTSQAKAVIGANIIITVTESGKIDIKGKIALFDVTSRFKISLLGKTLKFFDSNDKIPVVLMIENKGKNVIKPYGEIVLRGNFGEKASFDIIPQNILAESQRLIAATPSATLDNNQPVSLTIPGFFIGKYDMSATVNFGEGSQNLFASTSFVAIPFKFIFGIIVVVIISIIIIKRIKTSETEI